MNKKIGDMPLEEFRSSGYKMIDWIAEYLKELESLPALAQVNPGEIKSKLTGSISEAGEPFEIFFADLDKIILPGVTNWQHPNFMAYFNSTASGPGILGELLAAAFNTNGMVWKSNPSSTELEETVVDWFGNLLNLPSDFKGIVYDTASVSTMHALTAARENASPEIRTAGLQAAPKLRLYCTEQTHSSIDKSALVIGVGLNGIRKIHVDKNFSMLPDELEKAIAEDRANGWLPFCVVATIGTTSTTAVDPVAEIAAICRREKIWLHIDAAHAGVTAMLPEMEIYFKGVEMADSFVVNPHKWLFVPIDFSLLYTKRPQVLKQAFSLVPEYLKTAQDSVVENYMDYGIQLGRRFRSLKFWFVLRYFGANGLRHRIREHLRLGKLFAGWIDKNKNFERLAPVPFSTVCFRALPAGIKNEEELNLFNEKLMNQINSTGKVFLSHTKLNGKFTIRVVVSGLRTEERHVKLAYDTIIESFNKLNAG